MTPLTRDEAREQVARAIFLMCAADIRPDWPERALVEAWSSAKDDDARGWRKEADAALSVLWPEVERLRIEANRATNHAWEEARGLRAEVERLRTELAHAHAVIARHVEPRREGEPGMCHSGALCGDLTASGPVAGVGGPEGVDR